MSASDADKPEPMDTGLRDLLREGAPPLAAPDGVEARLLARLSGSIPGLIDPSPGGGGSGGGGGGGAGVVSAPTAVGLSTGVKAAIGIGLASAVLVGVVTFRGDKEET